MYLQSKYMRVERTVDSKVKESLRPAIPGQNGIPIPLVSMPQDRVIRNIVRLVDGCTCVDSRGRIPEGKWQCHQFPGRGDL